MTNRLVLLIPFLAALNGVNFVFSGLNIRLDQVTVVILMFILIWNNILKKIKIEIDFVGKLLIAYLVISFISTFIFAPDVKQSLIQTINISSAASVYFVLTNFLNNDYISRKFLRYFLIAGIISIGYGIVAFSLSSLGMNIYGASTSNYSSVAYGVVSTMKEPNIYGSFSVIYFMLCLTILVTLKKELNKFKRIITYCFIISMVGVFLSFTRGVWIGAIFGTTILLLTSLKYNFSAKFVAKLGLYIFIIIGVFFIVNNFVPKTSLINRLSFLTDYQEGTGAERLLSWNKIFNNFLDSPILGHGTYSYASYLPASFEVGKEYGGWIGNFILRLLHDTGVIGTFIFSMMIWALLKKNLAKLKNIIVIDRFHASVLLGFCIALISMLIAFLFTTAFSYIFSWSVLGLITVYGKSYDIK